MLHAVVMAGGSGTRFWPMSRQNRPKHLLPLSGSQTLIQDTVHRVAPLVAPDRTWIITGADHAQEVRRQLSELPKDSIIAEPCRRDTAPCIGLAAMLVSKRDPSATMVVMPADHVIDPEEEFRRTIEVAVSLVAEDDHRLVTLGIKPNRPATGYGYIHKGSGLPSRDQALVFKVQSFREKPHLELAEQYVRSGEFFWNSGIFIWSAKTILDELRASRPDIADSLGRIMDAWDSAAREAVLAEQYENIKGVSIDYAVLERARNMVVIEANFRWDDVGSWGAIQRLRGQNAEGNTVVGNHRGIDTRESVVLTDADHLVATIGVGNLIIVQCGNATLVADKEQEESVKGLVDLLRQQGLERFL